MTTEPNGSRTWRLLGMTALCAVTSACVTGPTPTEKRLLPVVVLRDGPSGQCLAEKLRENGFEKVTTRGAPKSNPGLDHAAIEPRLLDAIRDFAADCTQLPRQRFTLRSLDHKKAGVYVEVHVPQASARSKEDRLRSVGITPVDDTGRRSLELLVLTDCPDGEDLAQHLKEKGYHNAKSRSWSLDPQLGVEYGVQNVALAHEVALTVARQLRLDPKNFSLMEREPKEGMTDPVIVHLPCSQVANLAGYLPNYGRLTVQVVTDEESLGTTVADRLRKKESFRNVRVITKKPDGLTVLVGEKVTDEVRSRLLEELEDELGLGRGAFRSNHAREDQAWQIQVHLPSRSIPDLCQMAPEKVSYGFLDEVDSKRVILSKHRVIRGEANWAESMSKYVGRRARVVEKAGVDKSGCAVVRVDLDGGKFSWRVRDLQRDPSL